MLALSAVWKNRLGQEWKQRDQLGVVKAILVGHDGGLGHSGCRGAGKQLLSSEYVHKYQYLVLPR